MHCTAPPAVPLVRLSSAATATSRPAAAIDGDLDVDGVGAEHRLGLRPLPGRQQVDERLVGVRRRRRRRTPCSVSSAGSASGAVHRGQDAPRHRHQHRGERDGRGRGAAGPEVLPQLGHVPVSAADAVRAGRAHQLRARADAA